MFVSFSVLFTGIVEKSSLSKQIIKEYQNELYEMCGVFVNEAEAEIQLRSLVSSMFPTVIAGNCAESREQGAMVAFRRHCAGSLSATMTADGGDEVGASITPTSRQSNQNKYE